MCLGKSKVEHSFNLHIDNKKNHLLPYDMDFSMRRVVEMNVTFDAASVCVSECVSAQYSLLYSLRRHHFIYLKKIQHTCMYICMYIETGYEA